jgi:hypothetical protein
VSALAPKMDAINNSRAKPVMREISVNPETTDADLKSDTNRLFQAFSRQHYPLECVLMRIVYSELANAL